MTCRVQRQTVLCRIPRCFPPKLAICVRVTVSKGCIMDDFRPSYSLENVVVILSVIFSVFLKKYFPKIISLIYQLTAFPVSDSSINFFYLLLIAYQSC